MKRLLFILLFLPLFAFPQAEKRYRSIIIDSAKALNGGIIDHKDTTVFEEGIRLGDGKVIEWVSGVSTGTFQLLGALGGDRTWSLPGVTGTFALGTGTTNSVTSWSTSNAIGDGTWEFSGNTLLPTTDLTNIGVNGTNRVGTLSMGGTIDYATNLILAEAGGGVQTIRLDASNNVKIGTGAPTTKLDVTGTTNSTDLQTGTTGNVSNWVTVKIFNDSTNTADGSFASVLPAGYIIENIIFKESAADNITGFDIGFTAGGGEIVANGSISASDEGSFTILQRVDDFDAADTIFIDATQWNAANLILYIKMSRIF